MPLPSALPCTKSRLIAVALATLGFTSLAQAQPVQVVTSFSILADMARNVGGEHVEVTSLVGPDSDSHVYMPRPSDARALAEADLVVFNGLQFEGWMNRLLDSSGYQGELVTASEGTKPLPYSGPSMEHADAHTDHHGHEEHAGHDEEEHHSDHGEHAEEHAEPEAHAGHEHGKFDPHAWLDLGAGAIYAANIRDGLIAVDPEHEQDYRAQADAYIQEIKATDAQVHELLDAVPHDTYVIVDHDAFGHFQRAYGIGFLSPVGLSTDAEPSAADLAKLIEIIKQRNIPALFQENMVGPALTQQLSEETGLPIAGTLYTGALSESGPTSHYLGMMLHNAEVLHAGLADAQHQEQGHQEETHEH